MIILYDFFLISESKGKYKKAVKFCLYPIETRECDDNEKVVYRLLKM